MSKNRYNLWLILEKIGEDGDRGKDIKVNKITVCSNLKDATADYLAIRDIIDDHILELPSMVFKPK